MPIDKLHILNEIYKYNPSHIIIGYSGGVDSSVLLNICKDINIPIIAIYINHNIHKQSLKWQEHCQQTCNNHDIRFISHSLEQCPKGESFEAWASKQRMTFFQSIMKKYHQPLLILGHHQDDQAETFLIQAVRGAGLAGLASIPYYKQLKHGAVLRPLLDYKKQEIETFAKQNSISHIYDDSNEDIKYRRNLIRNKIIPILQQVNPSVNETLSRSANICAQSKIVLDKLLAEKLENISDGININISKFIELDEDIQKNILHFWFKKNTLQSLKSKQIEDIYFGIKNKNNSTGWKLDINKIYQVYIEYNLLLIKKTIDSYTTTPTKDIIEWLSNNLSYEIDLNKIIIRERQSNDKCKYPSRNKANKLKIIFQELKIPASERSKARIIELNRQIIAIYPFFVCE
ncbi:tRNA(Ile)-lysidine synthetase [Candidatus Francisella endociliophora]|uniref:tRNA(Ile)-lysidine synthase n=1 Tax=Candidatus Francisella endociliophora TaxID=653937 RepID=A0A097EN76_9GAMM|nr:tRNA lysidine(34) synthetase TilS [Francisella sp. FSC1006]AIT09018.1 tRNA(Ile)-lysidine synthetase [Francisella sp. FSC1006]